MARCGKKLDSKSCVELGLKNVVFSLNHENIHEIHRQGASIDEIASAIEHEGDSITQAFLAGKSKDYKFNDLYKTI